MARMLPPVCPEKVSSSGERFLFQQLRDAPNSDSWCCLHSLELSRHVSKLCGEIDFVVAVPGEGIFCLEVKSGGVSRRGGTWLYEDCFGNVHTNFEGPFKQSKSATHSLFGMIKLKFALEDRLPNLVYDWGVVLPDVEFDESGPDMESWRVYDARSRQYPINHFIKQLSEGCHSNLKNCRWYDEKESRPTKTDVKRLVEFLRGDFELHVKKGLYAQELHEEIVRLTKEQTLCLENLRDNPRCFFAGAAGTGKTVLAVEFAKREAINGKKVLFLCYNKILAHRLKSELSEFQDRVTVETFHRYAYELALRSSCRANFLSENQKSDNETRFKQLFPFFALVALEEGFEKPFDVLVVDECQDLLIPEYLDVFDVLVSGGLGNGRWAFFGDMFLQNIFNTGMSSDQMLDELGKRSPGHVKFRLSANCRNTRNIGRDTCRILGFKDLPYRPRAPSGSPVEYFYYKDPTEQTEIVADIIRELQIKEIRRDDITVLCRRRFENSSLGDNTTQGYLKFCELVAGATADNDDYGINFCTIQSFKGMENSAIIVTDIFELDSAYNRSIIYVAMSRALIKLFVLLPKSLKKRVQMALNS